jgi:hypothetical protein
MPPPIRFHRCARCDGWVATTARHCSACGELADEEAADECDACERPWHHRVLWIQLAGIFGPASLFLTYNALLFIAFPSNTLQTVVGSVVVGRTVLLGMSVCATGVVLAFRAVTGMGGVQVDPEGRESAKFWGALAGLALRIYWVAVGIWVCHLF